MCCDVPAELPGVVLELPPHRIERIAYRDIHIRIPVVLVGLAVRHERVAGYRYFNSHVILIACRAVPMGFSDRNTAGEDGVEKSFKLLSTRAHFACDCIGFLDVLECDL